MLSSLISIVARSVCWLVLRVIVTHCHPDHIGLAHWICAGGDKQRWDVRLWMTLGEYMQARVMAAGDGSNAGGAGAAIVGSGVGRSG